MARLQPVGTKKRPGPLSEFLGGPRFALAYRNLAPPTAREVERQLYITDLETLLELLRFG